MEWGVKLLADLQRMGEKMDRTCDSLSEQSPFAQETEMWHWVEELSKFQGTRRRTLRSRSNKTIKS